MDDIYEELGDGPRCVYCGSLKYNGHFANCETHKARDTSYQAVALELGKSYEALEKENARLKQDLEDMRDLAYNRAPKLAAEECNKQKAELQAQLNYEISWKEANAAQAEKLTETVESLSARLAEAEREVKRSSEIVVEQNELIVKAEARAEALRAALEAALSPER